MLPPEYLESVAEPLQEIYSELQTVIQQDIARRIAKTGRITDTAAYQIVKLRQIGESQTAIQKEIAKSLRLSGTEVAIIFQEAGLKSITGDLALQKAAIEAGIFPASVTPLGMSASFAQVMNANAIRTVNTLQKLTGTIAIDASGKLNQFMDMAQLMVQSGAYTQEQAVDAAVKKFAADGVGAFDYFSGVRTSIEAAVRRACITGVNQATAEVSLANAAELETDLVEVTSHADSRPEHAKWQGGIYSISGNHPEYRKLSDATGYGTVRGLCGANCRHSFYPFIEGVSEQQPKEPYDPKTYEAEQEQRNNERQIRNWKRRAATLEAGGVDSSAAKGKVAYWQSRQREHIAKNKLARLYDREKVYGKSGVVKINTAGIAARADKLYNTGTQSGNIAGYLRDKPIRDKILSGELPKTIHEGRQGKHIPGHNNYIEGRSVLIASQNAAQKIVNKYAGHGELLRNRKGTWDDTELFQADRIIGKTIDRNGQWKFTDRGVIHYSNAGTHIVPTLRRFTVGRPNP